MEVVDHGPQFWFFVREGDRHYLSVRCQQSFVEFETLIQLSAEEWREYHAVGHVYLDYLAARVSYWAHDYASRNLSQQIGAKVHQAIMKWKATQPDA